MRRVFRIGKSKLLEFPQNGQADIGFQGTLQLVHRSDYPLTEQLCQNIRIVFFCFAEGYIALLLQAFLLFLFFERVVIADNAMFVRLASFGIYLFASP
ncbi:MAG: hypothetical protein GY854_04650 [Deltaproteobacteria bacterium]|nr:hypothetical protein [Deltaproteobacteria bacterium]